MPVVDDPLLTSAQFVRGVGPARAELLAKMGLTTVADLLFNLREMTGMTLILVTHDNALAARCTRQIRLRDGTVMEDTLRTLISGSIGALSKT